MKRAAKMPASTTTRKPFSGPIGRGFDEHLRGLGPALAGANCPNARAEVFISGTQPSAECELHGLDARQTGAADVGGRHIPASKLDSLAHQ